MPDPVHGHVLVPLAQAAPRQPQAARMHAPNPATGYQAPPPPGPPGSNVIAFPSGIGRSSKLVRGLIDKDGRSVDPYQEFMAGVPDLMPGMVPNSYFEELVPNEEEMARMIPRATAVHEMTEAHEDPAADAFGVNGAESRRMLPLSKE